MCDTERIIKINPWFNTKQACLQVFKDMLKTHSIVKMFPLICSTHGTGISFVESNFELHENVFEKCHMEQDTISFLQLTDTTPHACGQISNLDEIWIAQLLSRIKIKLLLFKNTYILS